LFAEPLPSPSCSGAGSPRKQFEKIRKQTPFAKMEIDLVVFILMKIQLILLKYSSFFVKEFWASFIN